MPEVAARVLRCRLQPRKITPAVRVLQEALWNVRYEDTFLASRLRPIVAVERASPNVHCEI